MSYKIADLIFSSVVSSNYYNKTLRIHKSGHFPIKTNAIARQTLRPVGRKYHFMATQIYKSLIETRIGIGIFR